MGLKGYRPLRSNSIDNSGYGNNGTDGSGVTYINGGPLSKCVDLATAKTSYINCGSNSSLYISPTICVSGWFNQEDNTYYTICGRGSASASNQYLVNTNRESYLLYCYALTDSGGSSGSLFQQGPTLITGKWFFFSWYRLTNGTQYFFVDGKYYGGNNVFINGTGDIYNEPSPIFYIGRSPINNSGYEGQIAGLEVGDFAITPSYHKNKWMWYKGFM